MVASGDDGGDFRLGGPGPGLIRLCFLRMLPLVSGALAVSGIPRIAPTHRSSSAAQPQPGAYPLEPPRIRSCPIRAHPVNPKHINAGQPAKPAGLEIR